MFARAVVRLRHTTCKRNFSLFQNVTDTLITLHDVSSLPWIVVIPLTTIGLRTCFTLPLSIWQRKRIVKQQELRKIVQATSPVTKLRLAAATNSPSRAVDEISTSGSVVKETQAKLQKLTPEQISLLSIKETRKRQKALFSEYNVQMWKNILLPLVQIPLWVTVSMGLRNMTERRVLETNNWDILQHWFPSTLDLSLPWDAMPMIAPMILGTISLMNVEYNGKMMTSTSTSLVGVETASKDYSKMSQAMQGILNLSRLSCVFMMGVSSQASMLLSLYWISSQLYSLVQNIFLNWLWPYQR
ncbi:COX18 (YGR062C) [Zygosaccharomyces parabailii]|nr:COX18 (YGR062C) [Zygosaccharomyces parabailii]